MSKATIVLAGRSTKEREIFGGDVTVSLNGRVIGILEDEDTNLEVEEGTHLIKMSKSHDFGSQIGIAIEEVFIKDGERLLLRYSPPLLVNAPGTIMVSQYDDRTLADRISAGQDQLIDETLKRNSERIEHVQKQNARYNVILIWSIFFIALISIISTATIFNRTAP